jgi:Zn-dependent peptidase ImmA (M78 family)
LASAGLKITKAALSKYEKGKSTPKQSVLVLLGRVLGAKPGYFLSESVVRIEWRAFGKRTELRKGQQDQIKAFAERAVESQLRLETIIYPRQRVTFPRAAVAVTAKDVEAIAQRLRKDWKLDAAPIGSLVGIVEDHGGFVVEYPESGIPFDGMSGRFDGRPVIVVQAESSMCRYRYNVARQLGHLLITSPQATARDASKQVDRFAAALLVPENAASSELGEKRRSLSFDELGVLKEKYGLSMLGWVRRARDLEIISEGLCKSLCIDFGAKGWRNQEPYSYIGRERPKRLTQMVHRAIAEGIIAEEDAGRICEQYGAEPMAGLKTTTSTDASPINLLRLSRAQRAQILMDAAALAEKEYRKNANLTTFDAFGEDDLYVENETDTEAR